MITSQLINPKSIVVVGGSDNINKPGGRLVKNIIEGGFAGELFIVNPKAKEIQGIPVTNSIQDLPNVEMGILAISAPQCKDTVDVLIHQKGVKAIIIVSAGFSEETSDGAALESEIRQMCTEAGVSLIGPNCIGMANRYHHSVFTSPVPELHPDGADLISNSGGVILFILECAIPKGLRFNSLWSIGNASQIGVEDVLKYMDEHFDPEKDSKIKLLYIENIKEPDRFLFHASSLIRKGCKIAAIKSGSSESGKRAASSHTGAIAASDSAVEAMLRKAGVVRCYSREELATVGSVFTLKELHGKSFAVVTHAGGPAVILTDALSRGGLNVPLYEGEHADELKRQLLPGSAVANPIDILGTGMTKELELAIDYADKNFPETNAIAVIFGSVGLGKISDALDVIAQKGKTCQKPIFPVVPSIYQASDEVVNFIKSGNVNFSDEVSLATAVSRVVSTPKPSAEDIEKENVNISEIRDIINGIKSDGYLKRHDTQRLFKAAGLAMVEECESSNIDEILAFAKQVNNPVSIKAVKKGGSDSPYNVQDIRSSDYLMLEVQRMMAHPDIESVKIRPALKGTELYVDAKYENRYGHVVRCGLGGVFVEILGDAASGLAPLSHDEALSMIHSLRAYKMFKHTCEQHGVDEHQFADFIVRLSILLRFATEIKEVYVNPIIAANASLVAVDAKIRIARNN